MHLVGCGVSNGCVCSDISIVGYSNHIACGNGSILTFICGFQVIKCNRQGFRISIIGCGIASSDCSIANFNTHGVINIRKTLCQRIDEFEGVFGVIRHIRNGRSQLIGHFIANLSIAIGFEFAVCSSLHFLINRGIGALDGCSSVALILGDIYQHCIRATSSGIVLGNGVAGRTHFGENQIVAGSQVGNGCNTLGAVGSICNGWFGGSSQSRERVLVLSITHPFLSLMCQSGKLRFIQILYIRNSSIFHILIRRIIISDHASSFDGLNSRSILEETKPSILQRIAVKSVEFPFLTIIDIGSKHTNGGHGFPG